MTDTISVEIKGDKRLIKALQLYPRELIRALEAAGAEVARDVILPTEGLQNYPPETEHNQPPVPYYVRGRGTQWSETYNDMSSERLGTQFYVTPIANQTFIGNRASYAPDVIGEQQDPLFASIGWRKLFEVAKEKIVQIRKVYANWVEIALKRVDLK